MKTLVFDIETAPKLGWIWDIWNQNVPLSMLQADGYMLSWAAKWVGGTEVHYDSLDNYNNKLEDEKFLAQSLYKLIDEADAVVTYNGDKFDKKVANTAFLMAGLTPPTPSKSIDLFKVVKQNFKFTSNKLDFVCEQLGLETKVNHRGFALWKGCMEGDENCWAEMADYNMQDVLITEQLYEKLRPWIKSHPVVPLYSTESIPDIVCNNCGSLHVKKNGVERLKFTEYQRYRCTSCGNNMRGKTLLNTKEERDQLLVNI